MSTVNINTTNNTVSIQDVNQTITVADNNKNTTVNISQANTDIVYVKDLGPQGPVGPQGPIGPQGPSGSATGVSVGVFNSYTSSVNSTLTTKANISNPTFTSNITVNGLARINMLANPLSAVVSVPGTTTGSLLSFEPNTYRAIILDVHAQNEVSSSVYSITTVAVLYKTDNYYSFIINKAEILQNNTANQIFEKIDYTGFYDGGSYTEIKVVNNLPDAHTFRFLARGIPY